MYSATARRNDPMNGEVAPFYCEVMQRGSQTHIGHVKFRSIRDDECRNSRRPAQERAPNTVTGAGCIRKGVEAGCLILKDLNQKTEYNVFFKGKKPNVDTAISFQGQVHSGLTTCMQGSAVDVTKWHQIRLHCPQEEASPKK